MGARGPKPQPAAIAKTKGLYRPSRHEDVIADSGALSFVYKDLPLPPEHLNEVAKQFWIQELAEAKEVYGYISFLDLGAFGHYCFLCSQLHRMESKEIEETIENDKGVEIVNPRFKIYHDTLKMYLMFCREFGFTPSSRSKITLDQAQPKVEEDNYGL